MNTDVSTLSDDALASYARTWLEQHAPDTSGFASRETPEFVALSRAFAQDLFDAGLAGLTWPREYGGQGRSSAAAQSFREEASRHDLPTEVFDIGLGMCGPTVLEYGTEEQRQRYMRPMMAGTEIWCQLFSEPGAGSDVAGLRTRAVRDGDGWILNGQKVWTTGAQFCSFGILLARTDPDVPKHRGLTMFIVDLSAPGVTVRPLRDMTGIDHFNEVFFDDVRLPADALLGPVDEGWKVARFTLNQERLAVTEGVGSNTFEGNPVAFAGLRETARARDRLDTPGVVDRLVDLYLSERSLDLFNERLAREVEAGHDPGARGSAGKVLKARHDQLAGEVAGTILGGAYVDGVTPEHDDLVHAVLASPILSLGGGTNEIQLNIVSERVLGLPQEPRVDLDVAFRDLERSSRKETA